MFKTIFNSEAGLTATEEVAVIRLSRVRMGSSIDRPSF